MNKIVIVSGYFNPVHKGHLEYFSLARKFGDQLLVIVNNDKQRELKGSKKFMLEDERLIIINNLKIVDFAILSIDEDRTVIKTLQLVHNEFYKNNILFFGNGGDQNNQVIPEKSICEFLGIKLIDGLGNKIQSSSWLLK